MKRILTTILALIVSSSIFAANGKTVIKGQVPRYEGNGYLLLMKETSHSYDTISVNRDGSFLYEMNIEKPVVRGLYLEYLNDDRGVVDLYLMPGKPLEVSITGSYEAINLPGMTRYYKLTPVFKGKTKRECEYLSIPRFYNYRYTDEQGQALSYKQFLAQIEEQQNMRYAMLKGTSKDFYAMYAPRVKAMKDENAFMYAWNLLAKGLDPSKDADFTTFVDNIDMNQNLNDKDASDPDGGNHVASKIRYMLRLHPELYQGKSGTVRTLSYLRDNVQNTKTREQLSDATMNVVMAIGGDESLNEAWPIYKQLSGKSNSFKNNEKAYNSLSKLTKGIEAIDFELKNVKDETVHFWDIIKRGKITYIDFWATWCGPCCMEIPFVEKLVEKYKGNDKIQFVSVSLDNDLKKWHGKLDRDKPTWEQYVIPENFNSKFAKEYNIKGIPRFMAFDGEGRIININEDRPSAKNIEEILNGYIEKYQ